MKTADVLLMFLARLSAAGGEAATFSAQELTEWPAQPVSNLKVAGLLVATAPASSVTCPGCEDECAMPVEVLTTAKGETRAFVACDKREDTSRVTVLLALLEQWQCTPGQLADALAASLRLRRPLSDNNPMRLDLGVLKGAQGSAHVELVVANTLQLYIAGHELPLADVLELSDKGLIVERRALMRCVDDPLSAAGGKESAEQRRKRIQARAKELKAQGEHAYIKVLATEEGLSRERIKQLLKEETASQPDNWLNLSPKGATQKKPKPQR